MIQFIKNNYLLITKVIITLYSLYALKYLFYLKNIESEFYTNITFVFTIIALYLLINYTINTLKQGLEKKILLILLIMSVYFSIIMILGTFYEGVAKQGSKYAYAEIHNFTLVHLKESLIYIPALILVFLGILFLIYFQVPILYNNYINQKENDFETPKIFNNLYKIWLFIFLCWLPYFILLYPGYLSWDICRQLSNLFAEQLHANHPIITTFYSYFIILYYKLSNNGILSIAVYIILLQMVPLSFVYAYTINKLNQIYNVNKNVLILIILFMALFPINPLISIIAEKGILFIIFLLLFIIKLLELIENKALLQEKRHLFVLVIYGVLLCLVRHNVAYALVIVFPIMLIIEKKYLKEIILVFISIFALYYSINTILINVTNAEKGEFRESMSMPIQQLSRVYKYHKDSLSMSEKQFIEKMVRYKDRLNNYHPKLSDPVKGYVKSDYFKNKEFLVEYIKLGIKYPGTYLNSFLIMSSPLWYPFQNNMWFEGLTIHDNAVKHFKLDVKNLYVKHEDLIEHKNKILNDYLIKTQIRTKKNNSMALFIFMNHSVLFYFFVFTIIYFIYKHLYKYIFVLLVPIGYIITLFLGPTLYYRYFYFLVAFVPILVVFLTKKYNNDIV